jgi:hypothetical protein
MILIILYLSAIVAANLLVAQFGPSIAVINAFLFIGLDLTTRDALHDRWQGRHLWGKMLLLITSGSILSWFLNRDAGQIALASFIAFAGSGVVDTLVYWLLGEKSKMLRVNGSNIVSAGVDSFLFPVLAFGFPILWGIVLGQFIAKVFGGYLWSLILFKWLKVGS